MADNQTADSWIKDGTTEAEPETTETPAAEETEVVETAAETTETVETPTEEVTAETVAETVEEVVQKFIDAKHGDEAYQLPDDVLVPQTRDGKTEMVPIQDVLKRGMMGDDYRIKTTELAEGRRSVERSTDDLTSREARLDVKLAQMKEREAEMMNAMTDPTKAAGFQEHLIQYKNNPIYRKLVDDGLARQDTEAELAAYRASEDKRIVGEASETVTGWIDGYKAEYPSVDPEDVRQTYSLQLKAGVAPLDPSAVRSIYEAHKEQADRALSPLQVQLAEMKTELKVLQDGAAADQHNATTAHAVGRAKTVPVATGSGAPAKTTVPPGKFGPNELQERKDQWVKAG